MIFWVRSYRFRMHVNFRFVLQDVGYGIVLCISISVILYGKLIKYRNRATQFHRKRQNRTKAE